MILIIWWNTSGKFNFNYSHCFEWETGSERLSDLDVDSVESGFETRSWLWFCTFSRCTLVGAFCFSELTHITVYFSCFSEVHVFCTLRHLCPCSWFSDAYVREDSLWKLLWTPFISSFKKDKKTGGWSASSSREKMRTFHRYQVLTACVQSHTLFCRALHTASCAHGQAHGSWTPDLKSHNLVFSSDWR